MTVAGELAAALAVAACGSILGGGAASPTTEDPVAALEQVPIGAGDAEAGRRFVARSVGAIDDTPGEVVELRLTDRLIRFDTSCNRQVRAYAVVDGVLYLGAGGVSTAVACSPEEDAAAPRIEALLAARPTFELVGDALTLRTSTITFRLVDAAVPNADDLPVEGTGWTVAGLVSALGATSVSLAEGPATVRFTGGSVDVAVGCVHRALPVSIVDAPGVTAAGVVAATEPATGGVTLGFGRSGPTSTLAGDPPASGGPIAATTTTTTPSATWPALPSTSTSTCDPVAPGPWATAIFDVLAAGPLTVEVDIDRARLRVADGSGLDLVAA